MSPTVGYRYFMNGLRQFHRARALYLIVLFAVLLCAVPFEAFATAPPSGMTPGGELIEAKFTCSQTEPGITNRAVKCVEKLMKDLSTTSFLVMVQKLGKAVAAVMTIYVALTGMKIVLGGMRNPKGEVLIMIMKVVFVGAFVGTVTTTGTNLNQIYDMVSGISSDLTTMVSDNMGASGGCSKGSVWNRVDCTILAFVGKVKINKDGDGKITSLGIEETTGEVDLNCDGKITGDEANQPIPDIQLFEMALSQFFSPHGIFILALVVIAVFMLFAAIMHALFTYIISLVALTFLFILAPVFFPLFLFQRTKQMFMIWVMQVIAYMIQPCLMVAFLSFLLATVNVTIHGDGTPGSIGLTHTLDKINKVMKDNQCTRKELVRSGNAILADLNDRVIKPEEVGERKKGEQIDVVTAPFTPLPYDLLGTFIVQIIGALVLLYIMYGMMKNVADFAGQLTGGGPGGNLSRFIPGAGAATGMASTMLKKALNK